MEVSQDTMFKNMTEFGTPYVEASKTLGLRIISMQREWNTVVSKKSKTVLLYYVERPYAQKGYGT